MPLKSGYSRATVNANIAAQLARSIEWNAAVYAAASAARKSYFKRFPKGALPMRLAFPKHHRLAQHYDSSGRPLLHQPPIRNNPSPEPRALARAKALYKGFTGETPKTLKMLPVPALPKVGLAIGKIFGILYQVDATGERFHHEFKGKARPTLIVASDGKQVFMRGGAYTFTKRGFVDSR